MVTQKVLQKSTFRSQDSENVVKQLNLDMEIFNSVKLLYDLVHIYQMISLGIPSLHQVVFETVQKMHHCFEMYVF